MYSYQSYTHLSSLNFITSVHATTEPDKKPYTDDMRAMVEDLRERGMIRRLPAMFQTPQGLVIHPAMLDKLRKHMQEKSDALLMNTILGITTPPTSPTN